MSSRGVPLLLASNRGPVSFVTASDGELVLRRGGGGLVTALALGETDDTGWVCAALTAADRDAAERGLLPEEVRMLPLPEDVFAGAYDGVANSVLWPTQHGLQPGPLRDRDWAAYRTYAEAFADALAEEAAPGGAVLVQDYHLALVPALLRARRPDVRIGHFSHTPWAPAADVARLPVARPLLEGVLGADAAGFLSPRWARNFEDCCRTLLGADVEPGRVRWRGREVRVGVHALGVDPDVLRRRAAEPDVARWRRTLEQRSRGRQLLVRVDRSEPTKGIVLGMRAYGELLRRHPEHRGRVVHLALAYPSRTSLPEYRAYTEAVHRAAAEVVAEHGTADWKPVHVVVEDDHARSLAALQLADVLLVNPVRDGMNLVAKEGPVLSRDGLALVLSREAGAADELGPDALLVDPQDVVGTAEALHRALRTTPEERRAGTARLAEAASALPPSRWLAAQVAALPPPPL